MPVLSVSPEELRRLLRDENNLVLMDVRLPEDHERKTLPGAVNNCVFEVAFLERLPTLLADKATPVCLFGESASSHEAAMAAEKLDRAGYTHIYRLDGCLSAWCTAGLETQGTGEEPPPPVLPSGRLQADLNESRVEWLGRNLVNKHWGKIPLAEGWLDVQNGQIKGGEFVLSLTGITCDDLAGNAYHDVLIAHLRSDDFFDTENHPEARLKITRATQLPSSAPGSQNLEVEAALTLRGITQPIAFSLSAGITPEGRCAAQASFSIDRTRWGVLYGSGKFFHRLAGHLVNDLIELQVRIVMEAA